MFKIALAVSLGFTAVLFAQDPPVPPPDSTHLEIVRAEKAVYPIAAARDGIQGRVVVKVTVDPAGDVEQVELVSGDPQLKDAALNAAKKFKFKPFIRGGKPIRVAGMIPFDFAYSDNVKDVPDPASANDPNHPPQRVQVKQGVMEGMILHKVAPVYPREARQNHVEGQVVLQAVIGKDGNIKDLKVLRGPAELVPAAVGAVQQWRYRPYRLNGEPVEVDTQITVNFMLQW